MPSHARIPVARGRGENAARSILRGALVALALLLVVTQCKVKYSTVPRMERLGNCPEYPDLANGFTFSEIVPMGKTLVGRGTFVFNQSYTKFTQAEARILRCADRNDPHCEPFQTWRFKEETCSMISMKGMIWTPLIPFRPTLTCPVKTGTYTLENVTVDIDKLRLIRFPDTGFWKTSLLVKGDYTHRAMCFYFECSFVKMRV